MTTELHHFINGQRVAGYWSTQQDFLFQRVGVEVR